ncbi:hypothetical protein NKG94_46830 [Micromonospora sp. M12]
MDSWDRPSRSPRCPGGQVRGLLRPGLRVLLFIITRATAANISGRRLLHAALVLAVLWWIWVVHSLVATGSGSARATSRC